MLRAANIVRVQWMNCGCFVIEMCSCFRAGRMIERTDAVVSMQTCWRCETGIVTEQMQARLLSDRSSRFTRGTQALVMITEGSSASLEQ